MKLLKLAVVWTLFNAAALCCLISESSAQSDEPTTRPTLRVLTYNIHHGEAMDRKFDYERLANTISRLKPDVVALQEVDNQTKRASGVDQAAELGKRLKMNHVFGNALYHSDGQYGEAVLSRFPLENVKAQGYAEAVSPALEQLLGHPGQRMQDYLPTFKGQY